MTYTDDPIDGTEEAPDLLEREGFANAVAFALETYRVQKSSSVVALVGPWGAGKSSVIGLIRRGLRKQGSDDGRPWTIVDFNPWLFQDLTSLQIGFLGALQGALGRSKRTARRKAVRAAVGSIGKRIAPLGGLGAAVGLNLSEPLKGIAALIEGQEDPKRDQDELDALLLKDKSPVLVVLDDLDRLSPDELLLVFKLIRLVGRLPYVHYLVAYDEDTLLDVLSRTGLVGARDLRRASDYLEKMIQLRLDVPPLRDAQISSLVDEAINSMAETIRLEVDDRDAARFATAYAAHIRSRLDTPRSIKRYVAQVEAMYPSLSDEVDPVDFLLLSWLRTAEPLLYTRLPAERVDLAGASDMFEAFRGGRAKPSERRDHWVGIFKASKVAKRHRDGVAEVLGSLFPRFTAIWNAQNQFGRSDGGVKRIANRDYFDRYFAFDVPREDILDSQAAAAYAAIVEDRASDEVDAFTIALRAHAQLGVNKLEALFNQGRDPDSAERMLIWIARQLPSIPENHDFISPHRIAANLCVRLYLQLRPDKAVLDRVLDNLAGIEGGMVLGARLVSGASEHFFSGSADDVEIRTSTYPRASAHFVELIEATFDSQSGVGPLDLPDDVWLLMWSWRAINSASARDWIARRVADGTWSRFDVAAQLVSTRTPTGVPNPVWTFRAPNARPVEDIHAD
ncbi:MAG: hypothetical protein JWQ39_1609 [Glaciihabitans sp.]|nr:hypothetical protein [Glaciihabitans sp.]